MALTVFDDEGQAHAVQAEQPAPQAGPSTQAVAASPDVFKRPRTPASRAASPAQPSPKRAKFFDYGSEGEESSSASSTSRRLGGAAVNGVNGHVNGDAKGKQKADEGFKSGLSKKQRKERATALRSAREALPVFQGREAIVEEVQKHETTIFVGETGSGKTTQIPQYLLRSADALRKGGAADERPLRIAVTQPRRVAAISLATRVAEEMGSNVGARVGYSVRFDDRSSPNTRLKFVTDGTLLQELLSDRLLSDYDIVVLDEAHERSLRTDMLMGFLKLIQKERRDLAERKSVFSEQSNAAGQPVRPLRIVVMSATIDAKRFSEFFDGAEVLYVQGRQHEVEVLYVDEAQTDYIDAAVKTFLQIHVLQPPGDVLVFLSGQDEIESMQSQLQLYSDDLPPGLDQIVVCPLYARLPPHQQKAAFAPTGPNSRKVILATNVAETSITIPGVKYVIDTGLAKLKRFHIAAGAEQLLVEAISKSSANQRAGRAGRESAGKCWRLYTKSTFETLQPSIDPEIKRTSFLFAALHLLAAGVEDIFSFPLMDPPNPTEAKGALALLARLGAVAQSPGRIKVTPRGAQMAKLPLEPRLARVLVESFQQGCPQDIIDVLSMLEHADTVLINTASTREAAKEAHGKFVHRDGDHLMLLNVLKAYDDVSQHPAEARQWCRDNFISAKALSNVSDTRRQLRQRCEQLGWRWEASSGEASAPILRSLLSGFADHTAARGDDRSYQNILNKLAIKVHPSSSLKELRVPCILYHELVHTSATYARVCSRIEGAWLSDVLNART